MIQQMTLQGTRFVEEAKQRYFLKIGETLSRADTGNKMYWSLINRVLNKAKIPLIPPLLENGKVCHTISMNVSVYKSCVMMNVRYSFGLKSRIFTDFLLHFIFQTFLGAQMEW